MHPQFLHILDKCKKGGREAVPPKRERRRQHTERRCFGPPLSPLSFWWRCFSPPLGGAASRLSRCGWCSLPSMLLQDCAASSPPQFGWRCFSSLLPTCITHIHFFNSLWTQTSKEEDGSSVTQGTKQRNQKGRGVGCNTLQGGGKKAAPPHGAGGGSTTKRGQRLSFPCVGAAVLPPSLGVVLFPSLE